jgi:hypothetical protein
LLGGEYLSLGSSLFEGLSQHPCRLLAESRREHLVAEEARGYEFDSDRPVLEDVNLDARLAQGATGSGDLTRGTPDCAAKHQPFEESKHGLPLLSESLVGGTAEKLDFALAA